jgi:hypothetical protein
MGHSIMPRSVGKELTGDSICSTQRYRHDIQPRHSNNHESKASASGIQLVYLLDEGSVFDAPLDKIWKYLQSKEHQHPSMKLISREFTGNAVIVTARRSVMGRTIRVRIKNTLYPPFGILQEHLEGPTAGSRAFIYYIPKGDKTGVTVVGDFRIEGADERRIKDTVMAQLQEVFDEDNANIKKMD